MSDILAPQEASNIEYLSKVKKNYIGETINVIYAVNGYTQKIKIIGETKWKDSNGIHYDSYKEGCTLQSSGESGNLTINILDHSNNMVSTNKIAISAPLSSCSSEIYDYIEDGYIVRNCTKVNFNGNENWTVSSYKTDKYMCAFIASGTLGFKSTPGILKSTMPYHAYYTTSGGLQSYADGMANENGTIQICVLSSKLASNDLTGLKSWLAKNPQTVVGVSVSPTKEKITFNENMLVNEGSITISSNTKVTLSIDLFVNKIEEIVSTIKSEITNLQEDTEAVRDKAINMTLDKIKSLYNTVVTNLEEEIFFLNNVIDEKRTDSIMKYFGIDLIPINLIKNPMTESNNKSVNTLYTTCNANSDRCHELIDYYNNVGFNTINVYNNSTISSTGIVSYKTANTDKLPAYIKDQGLNYMVTAVNKNLAGTITTTTNSALKARLINMAKVYETCGVKVISIGKDYDPYYSIYDDTFMRSVISSIRAVYSGKITYSASMEEANKINWWEACDFIGINFYPIISTDNLADMNTLFNNYFLINEEDIIKDSPYNFLKNLSEKYNKAIYITEFGVEIGSSSEGQVNQMIINSNINWEDIQYRAYKSFIKFITNCNFVIGCNLYGDCIDYDNWNDVKIKGNDKIESLIKSLKIK